MVKKMHGKDGKEKALHGKDGKEADVTHVYDDVTKFRTGTAHCHIHNAKCKLPAADLLISGFSCKDMSKANPNRKLMRSSQVVLNSSSPGKTAGTLQGTFSVIEQMMPEAFVLENTDLDQDNEHREGLDHILSELAAKGYDTQAYIVNSVDFGLPQIRRRLFIVGVLSPGRKFKTTSFLNFWSRFKELLFVCRMEPPTSTMQCCQTPTPLLSRS